MASREKKTQQGTIIYMRRQFVRFELSPDEAETLGREMAKAEQLGDAVTAEIPRTELRIGKLKLYKGSAGGRRFINLSDEGPGGGSGAVFYADDWRLFGPGLRDATKLAGIVERKLAPIVATPEASQPGD